MTSRVTIQDIAAEHGLSRNTVSKALNNGSGLADATRERIIQKAVEMGYKQFVYTNTATSLQTQATSQPLADIVGKHEIALFSANFLGGSHFASLMLDSFQNQIAQLGFSLSMHRVTPEQLETLELPLTFRIERVAAILCIEMFDRKYDEMICDLGLPTLFVDTPPKLGNKLLSADMLFMDNSSELTRLIKDVIAAGKTRIGFIGDYDHCNSFNERFIAYHMAMVIADVPIDKRFTIKENKKAQILEELAKLDELPDMFVCANDFVALDALQALRDLGYDVPTDVWLSGFDDSGESRTCMPALTTVHIHTQIMAYMAVELLRTRIIEPSLDYRQVYTETNLRYRDSTPLS